LNDFPIIRPLVYVLKYFLRQRKLNESYTGGISSFLLFNLIYSYIQYECKEKNSRLKTLGHILTGFLQYYSFIFNFEDVGISIRYGGFFYKKTDRYLFSNFSPLYDPKKSNLLSVENFQELDQDIGRSSFKFRKVLDCFKQARDALYYPSQYPIKSYIGSFINVDHFLIERSKKLNNIK
jgi:non-canonical poly(A) RNA polymerase PAPD5/7